ERRVRGRRVRHPRGMLDEALDTAKRLRELEELRPCTERDRFRFGLGEERDHAAEVAHLRSRDLMSRMSGQPREEDALDGGMAVEELGDAARVVAVLAHAH